MGVFCLVTRIRTGKVDGLPLRIRDESTPKTLNQTPELEAPMRTFLFLIVIAVLMGIAPIDAANMTVQPAEKIRTCASPEITMPKVVVDALKKGLPLKRSDVMLVGDFGRFFRCLGAGNDLAELAARQQRYTILGPTAPIILNYNEEMVGIIADYERSWTPGQSLIGESPAYLRKMVGSWLVGAVALRAGKTNSASLQAEYVFLKRAGIKSADPNLRLLARRIAESAKAEWMSKQKPIEVRITPVATLVAAR